MRYDACQQVARAPRAFRCGRSGRSHSGASARS